MATTIVVAGATGNLGGRITGALLERGASVCAIVRAGSGADKIAKLETRGAKVVQLDMSNVAELARACTGAACVVSALQGLREVIVDVQSALLEGAIAAQ